jgi:thioredoxin-dependent peroxiredoxin
MSAPRSLCRVVIVQTGVWWAICFWHATSIAQAPKLNPLDPLESAVLHIRSLVIFGVAAFLTWLPGLAADSPPPVAIGSPAPSFKLQDQNGKWHTLDEYRGKWLVLYFYPRDQTPGCTTEACEFRDDVFAFRAANAVIVGISVDDVESHKKFESKHGLPFTLLADSTKETTKAYGSLMMLIRFAKRDTFLIDPNGRIAKIYRGVDPEGHSKAVLAEIKKQELDIRR